MANYFGKAENTANQIVMAFENGNVPTALSQVFVSGLLERHCAKYSRLNQFIVAINGYTDCMGFQQWKKEGRNVIKGQKAFYILAPCLRKTGQFNEKGEELTICTGFKGVTVFGYEQTEGKPRVEDPDAVKFLDELPFIEVAKSWGLEVSAYNGQEGQALGFYSLGNSINMGVENLSTWTHELAHAADDKIGNLSTSKRDRAIDEVVAEFAGAVLLTMIGKEVEADLGGAFEYIKSWAGSKDMKVADACRKVLSRVCNVIDKIMTTSEELAEVKS